MMFALVACIFLLSTVSTSQDIAKRGYPCSTKKLEDLLVGIQKDIAELKSRHCNKETPQTLTLCEGQRGKISCKDRETISVDYANFGRLNRETCKHRLSLSMKDTYCRAANSLSLVQNKCNKKNSCDLNSSNSVFGDPCGGTYKYLRVVYRCES